MRKAPIHIDDTAIGLPEVREKLLSLISSGVSPDLVVIDDLQILAPDIKKAEPTETVIRKIKVLAQEIGVPVVSRRALFS